MDLEAHFRERDIAKAAGKLAELERFADTRDSFVAGLALAQLTPNERYTINQDDEAICEAIAFGHFYLIHLADLEAQASELRQAA